MEQFDNFIEKHMTVEIAGIMLLVIFAAIIVFVTYNIIRSVRWWKKSKNYVNQDAQIGDEVWISTNSLSGKILKRNDDGTFNLLIKVHESHIYLKENATRVIDLDMFRTPGDKTFVGKDYGINVRRASNIDNIAKLYDKISIKIPADVYSINPSFLEEFIRNLVTSFGEKGFRQKVEFINPGYYKIDNDLNESIDRVLRNV